MTDAWGDCRDYLEAHCNPTPEPFPPTSVRYAQVLWLLADCLAVKTVLEVGIGPTAVSGSTFILNMAQRGGGFLLSVDIDQHLPRDVDRQLALTHGVHWTQLYGDSLDVVKQVPEHLRADLLYIDGDHDKTHAYGDTMAYLPFLRPGGYLVIDDFPVFGGVVEALQEFTRHGLQFVHLAHEAPHGNGRLLWQKPGPNQRILLQQGQLVFE